MNNPHDIAFKTAFRRKDLAISFFRHYLPEEIVRDTDFGTLELINGSYVDEAFAESHSDIVYRVRLRGKDVFLYILFEHQSTPDRMMAFRLLCYMVNLWRDYIAQHPKTKHLPAILPLVLYHGKQRWNAPLSFREMVTGGGDFREYVPDFIYRLYDLGRHGNDLLRSGNAALNVTLHLFRHIFDAESGTVFGQTADMVIEIEDAGLFAETLRWAVTYFLNARNEDAGELIKIISREAGRVGDERIRREAMTAAEQLRKQGEVLGASGIILKQARKRFGKLSPVLEQKLRKSDLDMLDKFGEAIFDFRDLKDAEKWWEEQENGGNA
ncbi:DUF4351 domain-containing protein [Desulfonema ishimotonii]|uniref:DUF4351 domain-containing protein n=1 Tax=Desulfonema ishimotonii TaxID=45657 RepID=A0A401G2W4_9BACT|nr:DUF4351 domain-containing protein [Desulfonema ishimotonii]